MLIRFDQVKISFGATDVLDGASFQIDPGDRLGLIGRNGSGKTTLLRLMAGALTPDRGSVLRSSQLQISYLEQLVHAESSGSVLEAAESVFSNLLSMEREIEGLNHRLSETTQAAPPAEDLSRLSLLLHQFELHGGYSFRAQTQRVLMGLGFPKTDFARRCDEISGGQMNRLNLARVLLGQPNLLLLDEPTNHLDLDAIAWLEEFLRNYPKAFLVVSHDRYFLNKVVHRILELERRVVIAYTGNYSAYQTQRALRREQEAKAYEQQQEWIERTQDFVRRNIAGQKTKQAQSRRKMLEKTVHLEKPIESGGAARFDFHVTLPSAHQVLMVEGGTIGYEKTPVTSGIDLKIYRGERYGIIGKNGTGKSTFLKTICGRLAPLSGAWILGERVHLGYYDQTLETLNPAHTVLEELGVLAPAATDGELRSFAARILFKNEEVFQRIENLSGGEKSRLSLAKLICQHPNLLLLDEPTNHLDLASREALEEALTEYDGALLVATHDRYLLEKLVTRLLVFENGALEMFEGSYSDYVRAKESGPMVEGAAKTLRPMKNSDERTGEGLSLTDVPQRDSMKRRPPRKAGTNRERQRILDLARVEDEIAKMEEALREVEAHLADSANYSHPEQIKRLSESYQSLTDQLKALYDEWAVLGVDEL